MIPAIASTTAAVPEVWALDAFPDLLAVQQAAPDRYPCLLESVSNGPDTARYDILFAFPQDRLLLGHDGVLLHNGHRVEGSFLSTLDSLWRLEATSTAEALGLPFMGGWCLYLGYELLGEIEPRVPVRTEPGLPLAAAIRCPAAILRDHRARQTYLVVEKGLSTECVAQLREDALAAGAFRAVAWNTHSIQEESAAHFLAGVERVQRYIAAGDVFQVNLSRGWRAYAPGADPLSVYDRLRRANPAPFAGLMLLDHGAIVSSSPERLVAVRGGCVSARPIAGTWPRSADAITDRGAMEALAAHPKERAEHIMLLDLERNDLGRLCRPGTVRVTQLMQVETYRYVHHLVSEVSGRLCTGVTPSEVVRAVFPGGTITGCPKVRCMEIVHELEHEPRGAYTGSLGYLNRDGSLDLNILIRTLTLRDGQIDLRAGSGIVADSVPSRELAETRAKALGLLTALGAAQ